MNAIMSYALAAVLAMEFLAATPTWASSEPVSESRAMWLSIVGTVAPATAGAIIAATDDQGFTLDGTGGDVLIGGALAGPSLGHFYAHQPHRAWIGLGIRAVAWGTLLATNDHDGEASDGPPTLAYSIFFASMFADIAAAKKSARKYNASLAKPTVSWTPILHRRDGVVRVGLRTVF